MTMRRLTQEVLIRTIEVAESLQDEYLGVCRLVEGLAMQLQPSDLREAIIQIVSNPKYTIHEQMSYLSLERVRTNITRRRNTYLRLRREAKIEGPYRPDEGDDDLALPEGLPDLIEENEEDSKP